MHSSQPDERRRRECSRCSVVIGGFLLCRLLTNVAQVNPGLQQTFSAVHVAVAALAVALYKDKHREGKYAKMSKAKFN